MNQMGCNTHIHESIARNLSVLLSLSQISKNAISFLLSLTYFLFNKTGEQEGRTGSAWNWQGVGGLRRWPKQCISKCKNYKIKERKGNFFPLSLHNRTF
jgi:hypothetical protein